MSNNNINTISGKRLTFSQLINKYHIQIPIIQRDYAQGRPSALNVRSAFLDALYMYLDENEPNRDLDFIYGNQFIGIEDNEPIFIPLDGQQRLTTLFLLHWYLANHDLEIDTLKNILIYSNESGNTKAKFTYETRTSSREFCDALVINNVELSHLYNPDEGKKNSLSKTIKDYNWYYSSWDTDPTIQSMLVMLDAIHEKFKNTNGFFKRLISFENPVITFQFLDLKEFNLTDDLYIKMNARGIPLTNFENFKANFEYFIEKSDFNKKHKYPLEFNGDIRQVDTKTYFSNKIDTDWANMFWAYVKETKGESEQNKKTISYDSIIMNLIKTFAINYIAGKPDSNKNVRKLIRTESSDLSFSQFKQYQCFDNISVTTFINLLDILQNGNKKAHKFIPDVYYYNENAIEKFLLNEYKSAVYDERIKFHGYSMYITKWANKNSFLDTDGLFNWMRVIYNLTENTAPYNNEREFTNSIKGINEIIEDSNNILEFLINNGAINYFDKDQIQEEKLKAFLIDKSNSWKELIFKAEQHGYFNGQIGFLLRLSGVEDYFNRNENCDWDKNDDYIFEQDFISYFEKAKSIFNENGINGEVSKNGDYLWERALLAIGDYTIEEGRNKSFLINNDRDISWKRLLKGDKDEEHPKIIKEIFDILDTSNVQKSLKLIIEGFQENNWKKPFIKTPEIFNFLGQKRYFRPDSDHGFALLKGERMSGAHTELYSYSLYINYLKDITLHPFIDYLYNTPSGVDPDNPPCIFTNNWIFKRKEFNLEVYFFGEEEEDFSSNRFNIRFYKPKGLNKKDEYPEEIKSILRSFKFKWINDTIAFKGFWVSKKTEESTFSLVKELCDELNNL